MKRLILIVLAAGGLLGAAVLLSRTQTPRAVETMAGAPAETPRSAGFVLGEYGGRVAVYGAEADAPPREITSILRSVIFSGFSTLSPLRRQKCVEKGHQRRQ